MKKIIVLLCTLLSLGSFAQLMKPVKFIVKSDKSVLKKGDTFTLTFSGTIQRDFYMYSSEFKAEGPLKSTLELDKLEGIKPVGKFMCINCKTHYDDLWKGDVSTATQLIVFTQKFTVTSDKVSVINGKISGQACKNDGVCVPVKEKFSFDIKVNK